jgi:hypothetical protein
VTQPFFFKTFKTFFMKRFSIGLAAVIMAFGFAAFTTPKQVAKKTDTYTYKYTGTAVSGENDKDNYGPFVSEGSCSDIQDDMVCVIETSYAPGTGGHPAFPPSEDVRDDDNVTITFWQPE